MSQLKFKLTLAAKKSPCPMGYRDKTFLIGSCFSENIGAKLNTHLFNVLENPHGILFNPISVANSLIDCIHNKSYQEADLFFYQIHSKLYSLQSQHFFDRLTC